jgi:hypothetical protein
MRYHLDLNSGEPAHFAGVEEPRPAAGHDAMTARTLHAGGFDAAQAVRLFQLISGMLLGPAIHRAFWAEAARRRPNDAARQEASIEGATGAEFSYLASATERFLDWSPGPDADRLAMDLLIAGVEALAERSTGD